MKIIALSFTLSVFLSSTLYAQFTGTDDFSSGGKDTARWGADLNEGGGGFSQTGDGVVRFVSDSEDTSSAVWPWIPSYAPASNSWTAQLDVKVPSVELASSSGAVGMGLVVFNDTDTDESMTISLEQARSGGPQQQNFLSSFVGNGGGAKEISTGASGPVAAVRISWNAATHLLSAEYDADGAAGGYGWTALRSFDPTLGASWHTPTNGVFRVALAGYSEQVLISATNDISGDNFQTTLSGGSGGGSGPKLTGVRNGGFFVLSWPSPSTGFGLEASTTLTNWSPVVDVPADNGTTKSVTLNIAGNQYFRLKKP